MSYTPGPWDILPEEVDRSYIRIRGTQLGGRYKIANVLTPIYEGVHAREAEETRANARLIAAAPDMLDLLVNPDHKDVDSSGRIVLRLDAEKYRAAIAKAEDQP